MKIKSLEIGDLIAEKPIIQGGMGVGISLDRLASAVMKEGGIGVLSGAQIGFLEPDFYHNTVEANVRALKNYVRKVRETAGSGILGVNLMVAMQNYERYVREADVYKRQEQRRSLQGWGGYWFRNRKFAGIGKRT